MRCALELLSHQQWRLSKKFFDMPSKLVSSKERAQRCGPSDPPTTDRDGRTELPTQVPSRLIYACNWKPPTRNTSCGMRTTRRHGSAARGDDPIAIGLHRR